MRALILAIMISIACTLAYGNKLFIFFINGINTTPDDADYSLSKLEDVINIESPHISWNVLYNETHGMIRSDLWDFLRQKNQERDRMDYLAYKKKYPTHSLDDFLADRSAVGMNLRDLVEQFHERIQTPSEDTRIVIVSHSQGNQYANQLWDYLVNAEGFPRSHIALIGIASPSALGKGNNFLYITANNDKVITLARLLPGDILPSNAHIEKCQNFSCHHLVLDYLADTSIRSRLCNNIGLFIHIWINVKPIC